MEDKGFNPVVGESDIYKANIEELNKSMNSIKDIVSRAGESLPKYSIPTVDPNLHIKNIQAVMAASQRQQHYSEVRSILDVLDEKREIDKKQLKATEDTAKNTAMTNEQLAMTNERLEMVVDNQGKYINILEDQLRISQLKLQKLSDLFSSLEDGVAVEKEIMGQIQSQIDENHPLWDYVKDKGGDIAVTIATPILVNAFKAFLIANGILVP